MYINKFKRWFLKKVIFCIFYVLIAELEIKISFGNRKFEYFKLPHIPLDCCFKLTPDDVFRNHCWWRPGVTFQN